MALEDLYSSGGASKINPPKTTGAPLKDRDGNEINVIPDAADVKMAGQDRKMKAQIDRQIRRASRRGEVGQALMLMGQRKQVYGSSQPDSPTIGRSEANRQMDYAVAADQKRKSLLVAGMIDPAVNKATAAKVEKEQEAETEQTKVTKGGATGEIKGQSSADAIADQASKGAVGSQEAAKQHADALKGYAGKKAQQEAIAKEKGLEASSNHGSETKANSQARQKEQRQKADSLVRQYINGEVGYDDAIAQAQEMGGDYESFDAAVARAQETDGPKDEISKKSSDPRLEEMRNRKEDPDQVAAREEAIESLRNSDALRPESDVGLGITELTEKRRKEFEEGREARLAEYDAGVAAVERQKTIERSNKEFEAQNARDATQSYNAAQREVMQALSAEERTKQTVDIQQLEHSISENEKTKKATDPYTKGGIVAGLVAGPLAGVGVLTGIGSTAVQAFKTKSSEDSFRAINPHLTLEQRSKLFMPDPSEVVGKGPTEIKQIAEQRKKAYEKNISSFYKQNKSSFEDSRLDFDKAKKIVSEASAAGLNVEHLFKNAYVSGAFAEVKAAEYQRESQLSRHRLRTTEAKQALSVLKQDSFNQE